MRTQGWEICSRMRSGTCCPSSLAPRRRALEIALLVRDDVDEAVDFRTLAVAVRTALQLLAARGPVLVAIDDVQWLDASSNSALAFALRRLPDEDVRLLLARRLAEGIPVSELEQAIDQDRLERLHVGPLSAGALHGILERQLGRVFARPTLLRLHDAAGGNPFYALALARGLATDLDPTQPLPVPETLEALVRARLAGLPDETRETLLLASAHGRIKPAQLDDDTLEPAFADHVIELADGVIRFTHPLLASVLYQGASAEARRRAHARLAESVNDPIARARHQALASEEPDAEIAAALEQAAALAMRPGGADRGRRVGRACTPPDPVRPARGTSPPDDYDRAGAHGRWGSLTRGSAGARSARPVAGWPPPGRGARALERCRA